MSSGIVSLSVRRGEGGRQDGAARGNGDRGRCGISPTPPFLSSRWMVRLCGFDEVESFAEEEFGATGFAEELEGPSGTRGLLLGLGDIASVGGEHEKFTLRHFMLNGFGEFEAVLFGHGDVAEEEDGIEGAGALEAVCGRVNGFGFVAVCAKDPVESVGDEVIVIDDKYTLFHGDTSGPDAKEGSKSVASAGERRRVAREHYRRLDYEIRPGCRLKAIGCTAY